ncbi:unnamed protein product, partial [Mesorhabditis belari]|uniref:U3 small nucleolar ribonucleoprotein protein MPP10 n=1 Tax=Mesorhabditis belari TaxID=2138241 RepID=A0AAF3EGC9_9BILA
MVKKKEPRKSNGVVEELSTDQFFNDPNKWKDLLSEYAHEMYDFATSVVPRSNDLPKDLKQEHPETRWQMLAHSTSQLRKDFKKYSYLLDKEIILKDREERDVDDDLEEDSLDDEDDDEEESDDDEERNEEDEIDDESEGDLFNMREEDLEDIDEKLQAMHSDEDEEKEEEVAPKEKEANTPSYRKTEVDDAFFSLRRMEAELDEFERQENAQQLEGILDIDDDQSKPSDYSYEDFFGKRSDVALDEKPTKGKKRKVDADQENGTKSGKKRKSVSWADGDNDEDEESEGSSEKENEEVDNGDEKETERPVLFGKVEESVDEESGLQKRMKKISNRIKELEEENLAPRSWELQGEVAATNRDEDTLLQKHIQFDASNKRPPEITEDFTAKLEDIIKQRIKDKIWDDPVRTRKLTETLEPYRNERIEDQQKMKQSLSEVYEKEFQKNSGQLSNDGPQKNPAHEEVESLMSALFQKLDALYHYEFAPPPVKPELKIVSNMAALQVEEVGIMASTDEQLLAPEETKKRQKGDLKADDERTKTDKLRARRKKKIRQKVMAMRVLGSENGKSNDKSQEKKGTKGKSTKMRSSDFMQKLNQTVRDEIESKAKKLEKTKGPKKLHSISNKFVL